MSGPSTQDDMQENVLLLNEYPLYPLGIFFSLGY